MQSRKKKEHTPHVSCQMQGHVYGNQQDQDSVRAQGVLNLFEIVQMISYSLHFCYLYLINMKLSPQ